MARANHFALTKEDDRGRALLADEGFDSHAHYFYTVFSQEQDGWTRQVEAKVRPHDRLSWFHPQAQDILDAHAAGDHRPLPLVNRGVIGLGVD